MKIISWNCNGAFRYKFDAILPFNADVWVIQELLKKQSKSFKSFSG